MHGRRPASATSSPRRTGAKPRVTARDGKSGTGLKFSLTSADEEEVSQVQASRRHRERGSALLLTLLLTLLGAALLGLTVDGMSLLWARSNAQTTANLTAAAVALERERNPAASEAYLVETARATAAWNGYRHGIDATAIRLEGHEGQSTVLVERDTGIFFLRMIRPQPIAVRARASVGAPAVKAGL